MRYIGLFLCICTIYVSAMEQPLTSVQVYGKLYQKHPEIFQQFNSDEGSKAEIVFTKALHQECCDHAKENRNTTIEQIGFRALVRALCADQHTIHIFRTNFEKISRDSCMQCGLLATSLLINSLLISAYIGMWAYVSDEC